jgi:ketosteroid isomerase-like protein
MSQENVETVRRAYEVLNAGGTIDELMDGLKPLLDPQVEWVNPPDALEGGTRAGLDGWRTALLHMRAGLGENVKLEVQELVGAGGAVFATGKAQVSGTSSGVEVLGPTWAAIWMVTDGRIRRFEWSWDTAAMLARFKGMERSAE